MNHRCPPNCHRCPDLDDDVMPACIGTASNQGQPETARLLTWCTCSANRELPTEDSTAARIAALEARIAELEERRMNPTPPAAVAVITAALDDYRLITPTDEQTPAGAARRIAEYLRGSGYAITPQPTRRQRRTPA